MAGAITDDGGICLASFVGESRCAQTEAGNNGKFRKVLFIIGAPF